MANTDSDPGQYGKTILYVLMGIVIFFLLAPILIVIPVSFSSASYLMFPPPGFSMQWYLSLIHRHDWMAAAWLSTWVAACVVFLATTLGTLASFGLVRADFRAKPLIMALIISPMVIPVIIVAIGVYSAYIRMGLGGSVFGLIAAHTCLAVPFVVISVSATLVGYDERLEWAAMNLGANEWSAFWQVTFPIIRPGILSGALFAFITSFDELIVALFVSSSTAITLPRKMWDSIRYDVDPTIAAVSTTLIILTTLLLLVSEFLRSRTERLHTKHE